MKYLRLLGIIFFVFYPVIGLSLPSSHFITVPFFYQQDPEWCGPASLQMVMKYWGVDSDQSQIYSDGGCSNGCSTYSLIRAAKKYGFAANVFYPWLNDTLALNFLKKYISRDQPIIVPQLYRIWETYGHWRVVVGYDEGEGNIYAHDPLDGPEEHYSETEWIELWDPYSNEIVLVTPSLKEFKGKVIDKFTNESLNNVSIILKAFGSLAPEDAVACWSGADIDSPFMYSTSFSNLSGEFSILFNVSKFCGIEAYRSKEGDIKWVYDWMAGIEFTKDGYISYEIIFENLSAYGSVVDLGIIELEVNDTDLPTISFSFPTPLNDSFINKNWIYVNVSVEEENEKNITFYLDNSSISFSNITHEYNFTNLEDGLHCFYVKVCDIAGNCNQSEKRCVIIDTKPPLILFEDITPANGTRTIKNYVIINVTIPDENISSCILEWNGINETMNITSSGCYSLKRTEDGKSYRFKVFVLDLAGNINSTKLITFRENAKPNTTVYIMPSIAFTDTNILCENSSIIDLDDDNISLTYDWFNGTEWLGLNSKILNASFTHKGQRWRCKITLNDSYEINTLFSNDIIILNSPPKIELPANNFTINETQILSFNFTVKDLDNDKVNVTVNIGSIIPEGNNSWIFHWTPLLSDSGIHTIWLNATDGENSTSISFTVKVLNIPFFGDVSNITTNAENLSMEMNQTQFDDIRIVRIKSKNKTLTEFPINISLQTLDFTRIEILKQPNASKRGYLIVKGIPLLENYTKTVYVDIIANTNLLCIKDSEIANISEISEGCNETDETLLKCDNASYNGYTCTKFGSKYRVSGLKHSGVIEYGEFCGDGICNNNETCSTCPEDCGQCPTTTTVPSGGGGGGGGGYFAPSTTTTTIISTTTTTLPETTSKEEKKKPETVEGNISQTTVTTIGSKITRPTGYIIGSSKLIIGAVIVVIVVIIIIAWIKYSKRKITQ